jgi:hypothetical protein
MTSKTFRLEFHFRRLPGGALMLVETRFWNGGGPPTSPAAQLAEAASGLPSQLKPFRWNGSPGVRGLAVLLLRHFANATTGFLFHGPRGSLAASLGEALTFDQRAGLNWAARMFAHDPDAANISRQLFECTDGSHTDDYRVHLGSAWKRATLTVVINGEPCRASRYAALAQELEDAAPTVVTGTLEVHIAKKAARGGGEKQTTAAVRWHPLPQAGLLPATPADLIRIRARVTRPAHLCLVWVGPGGATSLLYPWQGRGQWPAGESGLKTAACEQILAPEDLIPGLAGIPISKDETGAETIVFLASAEPLDFAKLKMAFERMPAMRTWKESEPWLPLEIAGRGRSPRARAPGRAAPAERGPDLKFMEKAANGLRGRHAQLQASLSSHGFSFVQGMSFPSAAK